MLTKIYKVILVILLSFTLFACEKEPEPIIEPKEEDVIRPLIIINSKLQNIRIKQNQDIDLKETLINLGIKAIDDVDGDITNNIEINTNNFDVSQPGEYIIDVYVFDSSNNKSEVKFLTVIVEEYYGLVMQYPIFEGEIPNEVKTIDKQSLFQGAFYFKTISTKDKWDGIEGVITLPEFEIKRYDGNYNTSLNIDPNGKNLDNPSIYMGGQAVFHSDVGLSLSKVLLGNGLVSKGSYAYRPFWRYITSKNEPNKDIGNADINNNRRYQVYAMNTNETNMYAHWYYKDTEYYYLPGDKLRMIVYSPKANYLQLQIEVIEKSTLESSIRIREENGWKDPENFMSPLFVSQGHGTGMNVEFKRVNAIDQSGNEGKPAIMTNSNVKTAIWENVYLHREINGQKYRVPFTEQRSDTLGAPNDKYFTYTTIDPNTGSVTVVIHPNYEKE
ncbi:MAG: hypothetical protein ACOX56_05545 [Acholeplasmataceae bacterium]|jgi:hypothetical protein